MQYGVRVENGVLRAEEPDDLQGLITRVLTPVRNTSAVSTVAWERTEAFEWNGGTIAYWLSGTGPTVLLVHGWDSTHADLDAFVAPLLARGLRVAALDLPAHGASGGETATLADCAGAIAALGARLGPVTGVIAHSAGCPSTALALERGWRCDRVVLIGTPERYERFLRWFAGEAGVPFESLVAGFRARGIDVATFDLPRTAAGLDVPALVVHSADDRACELRGARAVAAAWPGSEFLEVDGLGHMRILRDANVIARVVAFVAAAQQQAVS
jgi:pimeloyl-ACP methyl ester carboxylesterase